MYSESPDSRHQSETFTLRSNFHVTTCKGNEDVDSEVYDLIEHTLQDPGVQHDLGIVNEIFTPNGNDQSFDF